MMMIMLLEIEDFNALIYNKLFFDEPVKNKQKAYKNVSKCRKIMILQQEIY